MCSQMKEDKYLQEASNYVVKSNDLIQRSRFKLNLQQQKMVLYIVSQIKKDDTELQTYTFQIADFCRVCGLNSIGGTNYQLLKDALEDLKSKTLWIQTDEDTEILVSWLGPATLHRSSTTVDLGLDPALKPYLLNLQSRFTRFQLEKVLSLRRKYSPRLYEILRSFLHDGEDEHTETFELKKILYWLDLTDESTIYREYKYLNRDILSPSIYEINKKTDIKVAYKPARSGHKVTGVFFSIQRSSTQEAVSATLETRAKFVDVEPPAKAPADKPRKAQKQQNKPSKESIKASKKPLKASKNATKKPLQENKNVPAEQQEEERKRLQVRVYARGTKKLLKTFSRYSVEEVVAVANDWLYNNGYPQIEQLSGTSMRLEV